MKVLTDEQARTLRPGQRVRVQTDDYYAVGQLIGFTRDADGPKLRILPVDRIERRIPLPATVTTDG